MSRASPESLAKAALITALRRARKVHADVVISELVIDKWANRADLVTVGAEVVGYEIKTRTDKLTRLEAQITSYSCVFDRVFVVAASRHINAIMTVIPDHVGIKEILDFGEGLEIRDVKPAAPSPSLEARSSLQLLPALEIKRLLADLEIRAEGRVRSALVAEADALPLASIRQFLGSYLRRRYGPTSSAFMTEIKGRRISPEDLQLLRLWGEVKEMTCATKVRRALMRPRLSALRAMKYGKTTDGNDTSAQCQGKPRLLGLLVVPVLLVVGEAVAGGLPPHRPKGQCGD